MIKVVLFLFLIGHILGDFYFQSSNLAKEKDTSFAKLLDHSFLYMFAMFIVSIPVFSSEVIKIAFFLSIAHFIIDLIKISIKNKNIFSDLKLYIYDQILHIVIIFILTITCLENTDILYFLNFNLENIIKFNMLSMISWILVFLTIARPFSITIKKILRKYDKTIEDSDEKNGHPNAGALIGILERCIILLFLHSNQYSAIGFVLTAKSIARYNKIAEDQKFGEHYLLGTLLSSLLVIVAYLTLIN